MVLGNSNIGTGKEAAHSRLWSRLVDQLLILGPGQRDLHRSASRPPGGSRRSRRRCGPCSRCSAHARNRGAEVQHSQDDQQKQRQQQGELGDRCPRARRRSRGTPSTARASACAAWTCPGDAPRGSCTPTANRMIVLGPYAVPCRWRMLATCVRSRYQPVIVRTAGIHQICGA